MLIPTKLRKEIACFSGCCIELNGIPTIFYTSVKSIPDILFGTKVRIAIPSNSNLQNNELIDWEIIENRTITKENLNKDLEIRHWRDPFVWKNQETNKFHLILGGVHPKTHRPIVLLYASENTIEWSFLSILYEGDPNECISYECPAYFRIDGKDVLILSNYNGVIYLIGVIKENKFVSEYKGLLDHCPDYYATTKMNGTRDRIILWTWLKEGAKKYWKGCLSLPRELVGIKQNRLLFQPINEISALMDDAQSDKSFKQLENGSYILYDSDFGKDLLDFIVSFMDDQKVLEIRFIPKHVKPKKQLKYTKKILFDFTEKQISIDHTIKKMNLNDNLQIFNFRIFIDGSKVEIFLEKTDSICFSLPIVSKRLSLMIELSPIVSSHSFTLENFKRIPMKPLEYTFHPQFS